VQLADSVVVVTGGGSGIGAALVAQLAERGAAAIVVADLAGDHATAVAERVADAAPDVEVWARAVDVADATAVDGMITEVVARHGRVDLYCSNAGIGTGAGVDAAEEVWNRTWAVNVMAHVHALRSLLPMWLETGRGHLLITASAAGLLTNLGDAPYSVTKHAAVGFAEWVSITHGDAGVGVSCLCPQGVRTPLLFGADAGSRPGVDVDGALAAEVVKAQRILEPDHVAELTAEALERGDFLVLPHEEVAEYERARAGDRERWLAAMRRLQARLTGG
jgi:NAD(P)-dependent dehydrogenase (short-subunit alcohol dehydrogenase family)